MKWRGADGEVNEGALSVCWLAGAARLAVSRETGPVFKRGYSGRRQMVSRETFFGESWWAGRRFT